MARSARPGSEHPDSFGSTENHSTEHSPRRAALARTGVHAPYARSRRAITPAAKAHTDVVGFVPTPRGQARDTSRRGLKKVGGFVVLGFAGALVASMALPAYAFSPDQADGSFAASQAQILRTDQAQSVAVEGSVVQAAISRDAFSSTAAPEPEPVVAPVVEDTTDVAAERAATAETFNSYSGPTATELLATAPATSYSLSAVFNTALQYQGVPYVYGGATPAGFDCSGFVMYVFAQYGISMPHSSNGQGAMGTRIPESEAQPGDLVIMSGHDGFYAGNGNILHAPYEGASVRVQPLWTSDYYIVRING